MDIVFCDIPYNSIHKTAIKNRILDTIIPYQYVLAPSISDMLADKMTAFAPKTTGILFKSEKYIEIIKQMFDVSTLAKIYDGAYGLIETFIKMANYEINNRGLVLTYYDVLNDTISTCENIISEGKIKYEEYSYLLRGIKGFSSYTTTNKFTVDDAKMCAIDVLKVCVLIKADGKEAFDKLYKENIGKSPELDNFKKVLKGIKFNDSERYYSLIKSLIVNELINYDNESIENRLEIINY